MKAVPFVYLLCLGLVLPSGPGRADDRPLSPFTARYGLKMSGLRIAETRLTLEPEAPHRYRFTLRTRPVGILAWFRGDDRVTEQSLVSVADGTLRPLRYEYRHSGRKPRLVRLFFDWERGVVRNEVAGRPWHMPVPEGTLDRLLVQLALMRDLAAGRKAMNYPIADGGKLKTYRFFVVGEEPLETPAGTFDTIKIERRRRPGKPPIYLWCAAALNYLAVRVEQPDRDGTPAHLILEQVEGLVKSDGAMPVPPESARTTL